MVLQLTQATISLFDPPRSCVILHLTHSTSIFRHRFNMDGLKNCNYHVLAPRTIQMPTLNLSDLKGPGSAEPGFVQSRIEFEQFKLFIL